MTTTHESIKLDAGQTAELEEVLAKLGPMAPQLERLPYGLKERFIMADWGKEDRITAILDSAKGNIKWRDDWQIDALLDAPQPCQDAYHNAWPSGVYGCLPSGELLNVERVVDYDCAKILELIEQTSMNSVLKLRAQYHEVLELAKMGHGPTNHLKCNSHKHVFVLDLAGFSFLKHFSGDVRKVVQALCSRFSTLYPETIVKLYLVNAPMVFRAAWKIARVWVHPATVAKIEMLEHKEIIPAFENAGVPRKQLPKFLGGENDGWAIGDMANDIIKFNMSQKSFAVPSRNPSFSRTSNSDKDQVVVEGVVEPPRSHSSHDIAKYLENRLGHLVLLTA